MVKQFIKWLYVRFVVLPEHHQDILDDDIDDSELSRDAQIVQFRADPKLDSKCATKH